MAQGLKPALIAALLRHDSSRALTLLAIHESVFHVRHGQLKLVLIAALLRHGSSRALSKSLYTYRRFAPDRSCINLLWK
jgi:hypothetical protein